jgi:AbrB family looped-hinge helix DNA binding protein
MWRGTWAKIDFRLGKTHFTDMHATTHMSEKGQVVIPKATRERLKLAKGERLEVIERPDGVLLRMQPKVKKGDFDEIAARIWARNTYEGPPVALEDMNKSIDEAFRRDGGVLWD